MKKIAAIIIMTAVLALSLFGCQQTSQDMTNARSNTTTNAAVNSVDNALNAANTQLSNGNYEEALKKLDEIKNLLPNLSTNDQRKETFSSIQNQAKGYYETLMDNAVTACNWQEVRKNAEIILKYFPGDARASSCLYNATDNIKKTALQGLTTERDNVRNFTFYEPPNKPKYINSRCATYLYISVDDSGNKQLRWVAVYTGDETLSFDSPIIINIDGARYDLEFSISNYTFDYKFGLENDVWAYIDKSVSLEEEKELLRKIANGSRVVFRFYDKTDNKHYDMTVSQADKDGIAKVLQAYEVI